MIIVDDPTDMWLELYYNDIKCDCGTDTALKNEPNKHEMHSRWCAKFMEPKLNKEIKKEMEEKKNHGI